MSSIKSKKLVLIFFTALVINMIWEFAQAPLYACFSDFRMCMWLCFRASFGDAFIVLGIYLLLRKNLSLFKVAILGILIAVLIELHALEVGRWAYTETMPIIPFLKVGLTPVLQMALLPNLIFYLVRKA